MARPSTPKLPVSQTLISEVLQRVSNAKTKNEKIQILHQYRSEALTKVLLCNFARSVSFVFPAGKTPYTATERPKGIGHQVLFREHRMIEKFIKKTINGVSYFGCSNGPRPNIQQLKKEGMWIQLLEELHPDEAEIMDLIKDKSLTNRYKITKQNVIDAFPELRLQDEYDPTPVPVPQSTASDPTSKPPVKRARRRTTTKKKATTS